MSLPNEIILYILDYSGFYKEQYNKSIDTIKQFPQFIIEQIGGQEFYEWSNKNIKCFARKFINTDGNMVFGFNFDAVIEVRKFLSKDDKFKNFKDKNKYLNNRYFYGYQWCQGIFHVDGKNFFNVIKTYSYNEKEIQNILKFGKQSCDQFKKMRQIS